jgi:hypothetical protein
LWSRASAARAQVLRIAQQAGDLLGLVVELRRDLLHHRGERARDTVPRHAAASWRRITLAGLRHPGSVVVVHGRGEPVEGVLGARHTGLDERRQGRRGVAARGVRDRAPSARGRRGSGGDEPAAKAIGSRALRLIIGVSFDGITTRSSRPAPRPRSPAAIP